MIIEGAMELFSERPYGDVSIDEICASVGVAHGLVSYYFGGKRGLFAATVQRAWQEMAEARRPRPDEKTAPEIMRGYVRRHFEYAVRHPKRFTALMRPGHTSGEVWEIITEERTAAVKELMPVLGCPAEPPLALHVALVGWRGYIDSVTLVWLQEQSLDLDYITDLCVHALIGAVHRANGHSYSLEAQLEALDPIAVVSRS